jgi:glyoxylase-like metal-dependent hydrolase (beta-lactamase superfamily II)
VFALRVVRIEVPIGVGRGTANAWLLPDPPVTLVDCGPNLPQTTEALASAFRAQGLTLNDLDQILLTHGHVDHGGAAGRLSQATGARVFLHEDDLLAIRDPLAWKARRIAEVRPALEAAGAPPSAEAALRAQGDAIANLTAPCPRAQAFDGKILEAGGAVFDILDLHGHTRGSVGFHAPREAALFTGDALLAKIVTGAIDLSSRETGALGRHLASLERLLALPSCTVHPGHGAAFTDHGAVIARDLAHHARRSDRIREILQRGPLTAWQIVEALFLGAVDPAFALSEVHGHLELLATNGMAREAGATTAGAVLWAVDGEPEEAAELGAPPVSSLES